MEPRLLLQEKALEWCAAHPKGWIAAEQGLGKTRVVCDEEVDGATEVVMPAFLRQHWIRQLEHWQPNKTYQVLDGSGYKLGADFYFVSYADASKCTPPMSVKRVVFDESHWLCSLKSRRTKACAHRMRTHPIVRTLSGTPEPNRPSELYPIAEAIGMTRMTYREWGFQYCQGRIGRWGGYDFRGASNLPELRALFGNWAFRVTQAEAVKLPPKMRRLIVLNEKPDAREKDFAIGELIKNPNPIAFVGLTEVLQEHGKRKTPQAIEYIRSVMHDVRPVLIACRHRAVAEMIQADLSKDYRVGMLTGAQNPAQRDDTVQKFRARKLDAVIGSTRAMGVGVDGLQEVCWYGIQVEADWSYAANVQLEDRLNRIGQTHRVQWDYLVCNRSIDARVIEALMWKESVAAVVTGDEMREELRGIL